MAAKPEADLADKPAKGAPVIRQVEVAGEELGSRILSRHVPALVISGALHVLIIGFFMIFMSAPKDVEAKPENITTTQVEDPKEEKENLANEDIGLDPDLAAATKSEREENVNVEGPKSEDPVGLPEQPDTVAPQTAIAGPSADLGAGLKADASDAGTQAVGEMTGGGSQFAVAGMTGRAGATKNKLLAAGGGNTESEAAVARGLAWLAKQQKSDGHWEFDGDTASRCRIAATGLALLPFLAAGETHKGGASGNYKKTVEKGMKYLLDRVGGTGEFAGIVPQSSMYAHAIACVALCEAAGMTNDPLVKSKATSAIGVIIKAQGDNGSWGYTTAKSDGDTSIVGWQIQALASAKMAGIKFDKDKAYKGAERFLTNVSADSGAKYGYRNNTPTQTMTPVGLLCRYYLGWRPQNTAFVRGVEYLKQFPPNRNDFNMYYYYYATQVMHFYEGKDWHEFWNPKMRDMLIALQNKGADEKLRGSWEPDRGLGASCGKLGSTCLSLLTLEVYYRHLPLYKRDSGGVNTD